MCRDKPFCLCVYVYDLVLSVFMRLHIRFIIIMPFYSSITTLECHKRLSYAWCKIMNLAFLLFHGTYYYYNDVYDVHVNVHKYSIYFAAFYIYPTILFCTLGKPFIHLLGKNITKRLTFQIICHRKYMVSWSGVHIHNFGLHFGVPLSF